MLTFLPARGILRLRSGFKFRFFTILVILVTLEFNFVTDVVKQKTDMPYMVKTKKAPEFPPGLTINRGGGA